MGRGKLMSIKLPIEDILNNLYEGVYVTDKDRVIRYWNRGAERISGYSRVETMFNSCKDGLLKHVNGNGVCLCEEGCPLLRTLEDGQVREADVFMHHKDGHRVPVHVTATAIRDEKGEIVAVAETFHDATEMRMAKEMMQTMDRVAMIDPLTGLANRRNLEHRLEQRLEEHELYGWPVAVFIADIDQFKSINDEYGHEVGDRVIKMVGSAFAAAARTTDMVGRLGGAEFMGILTLDSREGMETLGERARMMVEQSFLLADGKNLGVTVSMGFAMAEAGDSMDSIIKRADRCMMESKNAGRNRVTVFKKAA
jgi:diguanylate cyclase (GGDEF)-like protein/PAS domain S-box-containing protein